MEEQTIACLNCKAAERITEDSGTTWPAWEPGPQEFACPTCGGGPIWAAETREIDSAEYQNVMGE